MAILNNCEIYYIKCNPAKPSAKVTPERPRWEVQVRTTDKAIKKHWESIGIKVKVVDPDDGAVYYKATFSKNAFKKVKKDGIDVLEAATPVEVVDGELNPLDPDTIGNGSIGNVRVLPREYSFIDKDGKKMEGIQFTLMGVQVTRHLVYTPRATEGFGKTSTERIEDANAEEHDDDDGGFTATELKDDPVAKAAGPVNPKPETAF